MKTDIQIQLDVMEQLKWEPFLNALEIGVAVKNGIVTLTGEVDSYPKKLAAEKAAKKIGGVKAIAEDLQIGVKPAHDKTDADIAEAVLNVLEWHSAIREEKIKINIENGHVKLEGEVEWEFERNNVITAIENLTGVRSVINLITVNPTVSSTDIQQKISAAFHRSASIDAGKITAKVIRSRVMLYGKVRSIAEKEDAISAAWNAPGVTSVESKIKIEVPAHAYVD